MTPLYPIWLKSSLWLPPPFPSRAWEWAGSQRSWSHLSFLPIMGFASMDIQGEERHTRSKVKLLDGVQGISGLGTKCSEDAGQVDKNGGGVGRELGPDSHG